MMHVYLKVIYNRIKLTNTHYEGNLHIREFVNT